jgi:hypothetical protein
MSQENVEVVRRMLEAWQREDFDAWSAEADRTIEWHTVLERAVEGPESLYRGHEGCASSGSTIEPSCVASRSKRKRFATRGPTALCCLGGFGFAASRAGSRVSPQSGWSSPSGRGRCSIRSTT